MTTHIPYMSTVRYMMNTSEATWQGLVIAPAKHKRKEMKSYEKHE